MIISYLAHWEPTNAINEHNSEDKMTSSLEFSKQTHYVAGVYATPGSDWNQTQLRVYNTPGACSDTIPCGQ